MKNAGLAILLNGSLQMSREFRDLQADLMACAEIVRPFRGGL